MVTWTQFSIRRRASVDRFIGGLPDAAEITVRARLLALGVDPATFPWHDLAQQAAEDPQPLAVDEAETEAVAEDDALPEAQDG